MESVDGLDNWLIDKIKSSSSLTILTGAGVSAESGVPTFRGANGLWNNFRAEDLATPEAFERDPTLVWRWYDWRRGLIAPLKPNAGHRAIHEFENHFDSFTLITQNVDGLHQRAESLNPVELHGNIWRVRCVTENLVTQNYETPLKQIPPLCESCGQPLRPHIIWFGESLDPDVLNRAITASENCDLFFIVGTSSLVQPSASLAGMAKSRGATVIEINLERTPASGEVDSTLIGQSGQILPDILARIIADES